MRTKIRFRIVDWAGNDLSSYYGTFDDFESAWGALYNEFRELGEDDFDAQMSEFEVVELTK